MNSLTILPNVQDFTILKEIATMAHKSGLLPSSIRSAEQAIIISLKGRELGIPPMQAFAHINIISGKPTMSSELMLAQIFKCIPKATINYISTNNTECIIEACRPNCKPSIFSFKKEDAEKAGLLTKDTWKKYPDAMFRARAISAMARALFPDALMGVSYTAEELGCEIDIDENGNEIIKDVTPAKKEEPKQENTEKPKMLHLTFNEFIFQNGRYKGKKFNEVPTDELNKYMTFIAEKYSQQEPNPDSEKLFELYNEYVKSLEK